MKGFLGMQRQQKVCPAAGFTLLETLIVLAVTGVLFLSAMATIAGRQNNTEFAQAVNTLQSQMQQVISDVGSGYYQNNGKISCLAGLNGPLLTAAAANQGGNKGCVFLGKAVEFFSQSPDSDAFNVYTIAALSGDVTEPIDNLYDSKPRLVASATGDANTMPDLYDHLNLLYGLKVVSMTYAKGGATEDIGAMGFSASQGGLDNDTAQQVNVLAIKGLTKLEYKKPDGVKFINAALKSDTAINPDGGVHICFASGGTDQSVLLSIGGSGRQASVKTDIFDGGTCS